MSLLRGPARYVSCLLVLVLFAAGALPTGASPPVDPCRLVMDDPRCPTWTQRSPGVLLDEVPPVSLLSADGALLVEAATADGIIGADDRILVTGTRASDGVRLWRVEMGLPGTPWPFDIAHDASTGTTYVAVVVAESSGFAAFLLGIGAEGRIVAAHYTPAQADDQGLLAVAAADGVVYTAGFRGDDSANDLEIMVAARSSDGTPLWQQTLDYTDGMDLAFDAAVSADGDTLFLAVTADQDRTGQLRTVALATTDGEVTWDTAHGNTQEAIATRLHLDPGGEAVYLAATTGADATDAATGAALWTFEHEETQVWHDWVVPFPSALSADGSTLVLTKPATSSAGNDLVQVALLQARDGEATSTFAFALVPGTDTWAIGAALAPDGSAAYFGGTSATDAGLFALTGEAYVIEWIPRQGFTGYLVPDQGAPAMVTGLHIGPAGTHLYATGIATAPMGEGYLHATSFVR